MSATPPSATAPPAAVSAEDTSRRATQPASAGTGCHSPRTRSTSPCPPGIRWPARRSRSGRWIAGYLDTACHRVVITACRAAGFELRIVARSNDFRVVLALLAAGQGVALVAGLAVDALREGAGHRLGASA